MKFIWFAALFILILGLLELENRPTPTVSVPPSTILIQLNLPAQPTEPAVRIAPMVQVTETLPPPTTLPIFLNECEEMHYFRTLIGLPKEFDYLGFRESNCKNYVRTFCCYGWWQLYIELHLKDHRMIESLNTCGVSSFEDINSDTPGDKFKQACATKALFDLSGYGPWRI